MTFESYSGFWQMRESLFFFFWAANTQILRILTHVSAWCCVCWSWICQLVCSCDLFASLGTRWRLSAHKRVLFSWFSVKVCQRVSASRHGMWLRTDRRACCAGVHLNTLCFPVWSQRAVLCPFFLNTVQPTHTFPLRLSWPWKRHRVYHTAADNIIYLDQ